MSDDYKEDHIESADKKESQAASAENSGGGTPPAGGNSSGSTGEERASHPEGTSLRPSAISEPNADGVRYYSIPPKGRPSGNAYGSAGSYGSNETAAKKHTLRNSLIIFGCVILAIVVLGVSCNAVTNNFFYGISSMAPGSYSYQEEIYTPSSPYIAVLYVEGAIQGGNTDYFGAAAGYQHQWTLDAIDNLIYDPDNYGLILSIDSPGGSVYEIDELYLKIRQYQEQTGNPVYSAMGSMAASGGYYISAPCDRIVANRNCWTGSIGVAAGTLYDVTGLLDRFGIKAVTVTSGKNKAMGSPSEPMTAEQQAIFQSLVDEAYVQFVNVIVEGRGMAEDTVRRLADGRIYTAKQALEAGLIDEIGTFDEAVAGMQTAYGLEDCEIVDIVSSSSPSFWSSVFSSLQSLTGSGRSDVDALLQLMEKSGDFPISYMCETLK